MPNLFADKNDLVEEYKKRFKEKLTNFAQLQQCITIRYGKGILASDLLEASSNPESNIINTFCNINESIPFFGEEDPDHRDDKLCLFDRFILDCIHFVVISSLLNEFQQDYDDNQESIDRTWQEVYLAREEKDLPHSLLTYINNYLATNKDFLFPDLIFQENKPLRLFSVEYSPYPEKYYLRIQRSFRDWLEPYEVSIDLLDPVVINYDSNEFDFNTKLFLHMILGAILSASVGLAFCGPQGAIVGAFIGLIIGVLAVLMEPKPNNRAKLRFFHLFEEPNIGDDEDLSEGWSPGR